MPFGTQTEGTPPKRKPGRPRKNACGRCNDTGRIRIGRRTYAVCDCKLKESKE